MKLSSLTFGKFHFKLNNNEVIKNEIVNFKEIF
jgi:hypothetical protein